LNLAIFYVTVHYCGFCPAPRVHFSWRDRRFPLKHSCVRRKFLICFVLAGLTLSVYWPVRNYDYVFYDDTDFVTENPEVKSGLTWQSFKWAWLNPIAANWHPITTLSHMTDCQFFGVNPGPHHLVNVIFHALNSLMLFFLLNRISGAIWRSAVCSTIFALHPLHVESVAWISERKDVLSGFFFMLTLWSYAGYAARKKQFEPDKSHIGFRHGSATWGYLASLLFFTLGLLSKPMLVTVPFVLLLLDVWPLRRIKLDRTCEYPAIVKIIGEKTPFFALSACFCVITIISQKAGGAIRGLAGISIEQRVANAIISYVKYVGKIFWPTNLAVLYPYPLNRAHVELHAIANILICLTVIIGISIFAVLLFRKAPQIAVGWFWFLGMLLPVIGLVQVGEQAMADRYTYLPIIGILIAVIWSIPTTRSSAPCVAGIAMGVLVACGVLSHNQLDSWHDTISLFEHDIEAAGDSATAEFTLGLGFEFKGDIRHAEERYRSALQLNPNYVKANYNLGQLLKNQQRWAEAADQYTAAVQKSPSDFFAHMGLGDVLIPLGRPKQAVFHLEKALEIRPSSPEAMNNLAWLLATSGDVVIRDGPKAVALAKRACDVTHFKNATMVGTLAAAYAESGMFEEATSTAEMAIKIAEESGNSRLRERNEELLRLYRQYRPFHQAT
jgi:hypothetical protein